MELITISSWWTSDPVVRIVVVVVENKIGIYIKIHIQSNQEFLIKIKSSIMDPNDEGCV